MPATPLARMVWLYPWVATVADTTPVHVLLHGAGAVLSGVGAERGPLARWDEVGLHAGCQVVLAADKGTASGWRVAWLGAPDAPDRPACDARIDLGGRLLTPGWTDAHTHLVFAGDRAAEFTQRMAGASYAEIAAAGGGILHTVRQTRAASLDALVASGAKRLAELAGWGARVVEIKTGYGLDRATEMKLLAAIGNLRRQFAGRLQIVATAMPAHAVPPEWKHDPDGYVALVCDDILPAMAAAADPPAFVDVFVERGWFDVSQATRIAAVARALGLGLKAHVDEFADLGGVQWAIEAGATSVEHLLVSGPAAVAALASSATVAVGLPLTSVFLRESFAPLRALTDAGAMVALGTDCNPGSAMSCNLALALQLAVLGGRLSAPEAVRAVTRGGAAALGEPRGWTGRLEPGAPFWATVLDVDGPDRLFYELGAPPRAWLGLDAGLAGAGQLT